MRSIRAADVPIALKDDNVEVRLSEVGEMTVGYFRFAKGTDLGPVLVGLPGDMCQCPHWGYMVEGTLLMRTPSGDHTYEAGQAFYWAPGMPRKPWKTACTWTSHRRLSSRRCCGTSRTRAADRCLDSAPRSAHVAAAGQPLHATAQESSGTA